MSANGHPNSKPLDKNGQRRGRPRGSGKWNSSHAEAIITHIREGGTLLEICSRPNMPSQGTVLGWAMGDENPPITNFPESYALARRRQFEVWAEQIVTIPDEAIGGDMAAVASAKLRTDSRKWLLSKLRPETYGDRLQIANTGGQAQIHIYLPGKPEKAGDGARVIESSPAQIEDQSDD